MASSPQLQIYDFINDNNENNNNYNNYYYDENLLWEAKL